jgi:hypothetical protein
LFFDFPDTFKKIPETFFGNFINSDPDFISYGSKYVLEIPVPGLSRKDMLTLAVTATTMLLTSAWISIIRMFLFKKETDPFTTRHEHINREASL